MKRARFIMRPLCCTCHRRPAAINYRKNDKIYYRKDCDTCARVSVRRTSTIAGYYKKKLKCDRCGFNSKYPDQFDIYHIDGNLKNCGFTNLRTVCANCQRLLHNVGLPWKQGDLTPDH